MTLEGVLLPISPLLVLGVVAAFLTLRRGPIVDGPSPRLAFAVIAAQALHLVEEASFGFAARYPALYDQPAWGLGSFLTPNLVLLAAWSLAASGLPAASGPRLGLLWFLALGTGTNVLIHLAACLLTGGLFPGTVSSLVTCPLGVLLGRALWSSTGSDE